MQSASELTATPYDTARRMTMDKPKVESSALPAVVGRRL